MEDDDRKFAIRIITGCIVFAVVVYVATTYRIKQHREVKYESFSAKERDIVGCLPVKANITEIRISINGYLTIYSDDKPIMIFNLNQ